MKAPFGALLVLGFAAAVCTPAAGASSKSAPKPPETSAPKKQTSALNRPIIFYLAKGEVGSCGPGCSEWIAAEGTIDDSAADRLRAFLSRQGVSKRPIYFHSPGGYAAQALIMGRLLRERGMTASIARTIPRDCGSDEKECASLKRSGRELKAVLVSGRSQCNSACVYAIIGARIHEIPLDASLGIHAIKTVLVKKLPEGATLPPDFLDKFKTQNREKLKQYVTEMGIPVALVDAAEKIPHETVKFLTREELVQFGIDRRSFVEGSWGYDENLSKNGAVVKWIAAADPGSTQYRKITLQLRCEEKDRFAVIYGSEIMKDAFIPLKIVAANDEFALSLPQEAIKSYDIRRVRVPVRFLELAAVEDRIELAEILAEPREGKQPAVMRLSTSGLASALASLTRSICRCSPVIRNRIDAPPLSITPWQPPARVAWRLARHEIEARGSPGMTAQHAGERHPAAGP